MKLLRRRPLELKFHNQTTDHQRATDDIDIGIHLTTIGSGTQEAEFVPTAAQNRNTPFQQASL